MFRARCHYTPVALGNADLPTGTRELYNDNAMLSRCDTAVLNIVFNGDDDKAPGSL